MKKIDTLINKTKAKLIESDLKYESKFIKIYNEKYLLPNNRIITKERIVKNNNKQAVLIIAITKKNKYLLVIQTRINNIVSVEFPSGYIENGESIEEAAIRELKEETGYYTNEIKIIDSYYSCIGIEDSIVNIVLATNCYKIFKQNLSKNEYINFQEFSFNELEQLIKEDYIKSVGNKLAFYELKKTIKK